MPTFDGLLTMVGTLRFAHPTILIQVSNISAQRRVAAFPRHEMPGFCIIIVPPEEQRAQGMPDAQRTRSLACK
ncbi:MAG TPA: hypothetical protein VK734_17620 [Bradyrhizobium sp.]|nr:hypothetical protein [Bradyrhizobium sp.]